MCLYPKLIRNRRYTKTKKNGGIIPLLPPLRDKTGRIVTDENGYELPDERVLWVPVGCGKCIECQKQKSRAWQVRLLEEVRHRKDGKFVTLTLSNESIKELHGSIKGIEKLDGYERDNEIATVAVRRFLERWRKEYKKSVRHWLITELGHNGTENIHLHGIIFTEEEAEKITKHWKYGYTWIGDKKNGGWVNEQTVNYITKYVNKVDLNHKEYKPKIFCSSGIGAGYFKRSDYINNKYKKEGTNEAYRNRQGAKIALPVYYRNKIYTEEEREMLWQEKLDKEERWVCGSKVSVKEGEEEYEKLREHHRAKNKQLGYGDGSKNWSQKQYERELRNINFRKRLEGDKREKDDEVPF